MKCFTRENNHPHIFRECMRKVDEAMLQNVASKNLWSIGNLYNIAVVDVAF